MMLGENGVTGARLPRFAQVVELLGFCQVGVYVVQTEAAPASAPVINPAVKNAHPEVYMFV